MNFYADAICTLKTLVRAVYGDGNKSVWRDRQSVRPPKYHGQATFDSKRFLCTRLKVRPCNKLIRPEISA